MIKEIVNILLVVHFTSLANFSVAIVCRCCLVYITSLSQLYRLYVQHRTARRFVIMNWKWFVMEQPSFLILHYKQWGNSTKPPMRINCLRNEDAQPTQDLKITKLEESWVHRASLSSTCDHRRWPFCGSFCVNNRNRVLTSFATR
jgi:hypothetical protein